jgi:Tfp pilus assembly protein PilO
MRKATKVIITILLSVLLAGCGYIQFQKVQWDDKAEKYTSDKNFSKPFQENMIFVLNFSHEDYYIENDVLYISRSLWNDKELLWNYCNKANSESWINERRKLLKN